MPILQIVIDCCWCCNIDRIGYQHVTKSMYKDHGNVNAMKIQWLYYVYDNYLNDYWTQKLK